MAYYLIYLHIACAFLSLSLFIIRGMMQLTGKNWRDRKVLKILPHLSDTLLFCSGWAISSFSAKCNNMVHLQNALYRPLYCRCYYFL